MLTIKLCLFSFRHQPHAQDRTAPDVCYQFFFWPRLVRRLSGRISLRSTGGWVHTTELAQWSTPSILASIHVWCYPLCFLSDRFSLGRRLFSVFHTDSVQIRIPPPPPPPEKSCRHRVIGSQTDGRYPHPDALPSANDWLSAARCWGKRFTFRYRYSRISLLNSSLFSWYLLAARGRLLVNLSSVACQFRSIPSV